MGGISLTPKYQYKIRRMGEDTKDTEQGRVYILKHMPKYGWSVLTTQGKIVYQGSVECYGSPKYWEFLGRDGPGMPKAEQYGKIDRRKVARLKDKEKYDQEYECNFEPNQEEEISMSYEDVKEKAMQVETGVTLVNGTKVSSFSDASIVSMITAENNKKNALLEAVGDTTYYRAKETEFKAAIKVLSAELDSRVAK